MTEYEKNLREIYMDKNPSASEIDCTNWVLHVYAEDEKATQNFINNYVPGSENGPSHNLRNYLEKLEERLL